MESTTQEQGKRFRHTCGTCARPYQLLLRTDLHTVHRANCPHCSTPHYFDNRDGRLDRPLEAGGASASGPSAAGRGETTGNSGSAAAPRQPGNGARVGPQSAGAAEREVASRAAAPASSSSTSPAGAGGGPFGRGAGSTSYGAGAAPIRRGNPISVFRSGGGRLPGFRLSSGIEVLGMLRDAALLLAGRLADFARERPLAAFIAGMALVMFGAVLPIALAFLARIPGFYLNETPEAYIERIRSVSPNLILDRRGAVIAELFARKTGSLQPDQIPRSLKRKLVFVEDQNFYDHGGVHWPSVFRALLANLGSGGYSQGGSTLTQQLSRILLQDRSRSIFRKLRELNLAYSLEARLDKETILAGYINHVYLGHGAVGMETAAEFYFGKKVPQLDFVEELILVCLPSAPERYSPLRNPKTLTAKLDAVYGRMGASEFPRPRPEEYAAMKQAVFRRMNRSPGESIFGSRLDRAPYVSEYVRLHLRRVLGKEYQYGHGLRVETTIDPALQRAALQQSAAHIRESTKWIRPHRMKDGKIVYERSERRDIRREYQDAGAMALLFGLPLPRRFLPALQTASIGIHPASGDVLFVQGGYEFQAGNQLNRAVDMRRQTGSAIKPIVYATAILNGALTPASRLDDRPIYAKRKEHRPGRPDYWLPGNISGVYEGSVSVRRALAHSKNIPAIRAARAAGISKLAEQFRKFFFVADKQFDQRFRFDETIAIGSLEMSPLEMASAFSAFGNNGVIRRPQLIKRVLGPDGKVLYDGSDKDEFSLGVPERRTVLPGDVVEVMHSLMRDSGRRGGVFKGGLRSSNFIGKTGTTNEFRDAWFVGVTPVVAAAVWVGYDDPAYSMYRAGGSTVAGPLWGRIISAAGATRGRFRFSPRAERAVICEDSGLRPTSYCPRSRNKEELFARGHVPGEPCNIHTGRSQTEPTGPSVNRSSDFE